MKKILIILITLSTTFSLIAQKNSVSKSGAIKLLVVTGGPTLKYHIKLVPSSFYSLFIGYDNIFWDHASLDEAGFQSENLNSYDVILMYNRSDSLSSQSRKNVKNYLESGKGLIVLHHALGSYNDWEWWWKEVVGGKYQMKENKSLPKSDYKQGEEIKMIAQKKHAISKGVGSFSFKDETYKKLWISKEVDVLYKTDNPSSDGPTLWISPYNKSKVVVIQPGHAKSAHFNKNYKKLIYNAILWANSK